MLLKICPTCGKQFDSSKHPRQIYCCRNCSRTAVPEIVTCATCGKEFCDPRHLGRKYCSRKCATESQKRTEVRACVVCGTKFVTTEANPKRYCSIGCRVKETLKNQATIRRKKVVCAGCGATFETPLCRNPRYCSRACAVRDKRTRPPYTTRQCDFCGEIYRFRPSVHRPVKVHYCSKRCRRNAERKQRTLNTVTKQCENCGKMYQVHKSQDSNGRTSRYCSRECMDQGISKRKRGAGNPNYRGGALGYRGPNWGRQRRLALQRDGYTCQICGKNLKNGKRWICGVHHIIGYRTFNGDWNSANKLTNLVTLCRSCHSKVEFGRLPCPMPLF